MKLLVFFLFFLPVICYTAFLPNEETVQQAKMYNRIDWITDLIERVCPSSNREKRAVVNRIWTTALEVLQSDYEELVQHLLECRCNSTSAATTTILPASTVTTTEPIPQECRTATNFTESWRLDNDGSDIRGGGPNSDDRGYACDLRDSLKWFRFTGDAGNRMLNTCPKFYSCGTQYPLWTDADMPQAVGVVSVVTAYEVSERSCKGDTRALRVMRCSWSTAHDLIYNYVLAGGQVSGSESCWGAFCGMI